MNMMNSTERIAYSRELIQKRIEYPTIETWVGYEDAMRKYWNGEYSYDQMSEVVGYYEALNTDWFDILTQNAFTPWGIVTLMEPQKESLIKCILQTLN